MSSNRKKPDTARIVTIPVDRFVVPFQLSGLGRTIACWSDLLGFGEHLSRLGWSLSSPEADDLIQRLERFAAIIRQWHLPHEEILLVNDGLIRTFSPTLYQSGLNSTYNLRLWLHSCLLTHCIANGQERKIGLPGIRTVICESEVRSYRAESLPGMEAQVAPFQPGLFRPLSTQLNTAFSKCFLADSHGSRAGLKLGGFYIEDGVIDTLVREHAALLAGDRFVFLTGQCLLDPPEKYRSVIGSINIRSFDWQGIGYVDDRTAWLELGDSVTVSSKGLRFSLREIIAMSPADEFSMFWLDAFTGESHGYLVDGPYSEGDPIVQPGAPGHEVLHELVTKLRERNLVRGES